MAERQRTSALPSFLFVSKHGLQATASAGRSWHENISVHDLGGILKPGDAVS
jgi:hypothetical protein